MSGGGCEVLTMGGAPLLTGVRGRELFEVRWFRFFCELLMIALMRPTASVKEVTIASTQVTRDRLLTEVYSLFTDSCDGPCTYRCKLLSLKDDRKV